MKRQWRKFIRNAEKKRLYKSDLSYSIVPWLVRWLHRSIKSGCVADIEHITSTLRYKHGVILDGKGDLCFVRSDAVGYTDR